MKAIRTYIGIVRKLKLVLAGEAECVTSDDRLSVRIAPNLKKEGVAFNLSMACQSPRNVSRSIDFGSLSKSIMKAPFFGLRPSTLLSIGGQLVDERTDSWKTARCRTYQPVLAFDLFMG